MAWVIPKTALMESPTGWFADEWIVLRCNFWKKLLATLLNLLYAIITYLGLSVFPLFHYVMGIADSSGQHYYFLFSLFINQPFLVIHTWPVEINIILALKLDSHFQKFWKLCFIDILVLIGKVGSTICAQKFKILLGKKVITDLIAHYCPEDLWMLNIDPNVQIVYYNFVIFSTAPFSQSKAC